MSFDAFEARLHFLQLVRKLNASVGSIEKVVGYAIRYGSRCGEDLWECITEECTKVSPRVTHTSDTLGLAQRPHKHPIFRR
jgi:CTD kinase subunit gamma